MDNSAENRSTYAPGPPVNRQDRFQDTIYNHPADRFWAMYLADADRNDTAMTDNMKGDTDGMLIFTGLFATTVAAFIVEFYKKLNPDSGDDTVTLLSGISHQVASLSNGTQAPSVSSAFFRVPSPVIRINALWFISLFLSLSVALASTLVQQWSRRYLRAARRRSPPHKRGPVHLVLFEGMKRFRVEQTVEVIIALLHLSVFLFLAGLMDFLFVVNPNVARAFLPFLVTGGVAYFFLTMLPFFFPTSPYDTPLTHLVRIFVAAFHMALWAVLFMLQYIAKLVVLWTSQTSFLGSVLSALTSWVSVPKRLASHLYRTRNRVLEEMACSPSAERAQYALRLTLKMLDEHWEVEEFFAGLPGFLDTDLVKERASDIILYLFQHHSLLNRMMTLVKSCTSPEDPSLSATRRLRRLQAVLNTFQDVLARTVSSPTVLRALSDTDDNHGLSSTIGGLRLILDLLARQKEPSVALFAACTDARLRQILMNAVLGNNSQGIDTSPDSRSYIVKLLYFNSYPLLGFKPDITSKYLRWIPANAETFLDPEDRIEHTNRAIQRGGHLDNLNRFAAHIWRILLKDPSPVSTSREHYNLILETMRTITNSFYSGHWKEHGVMWKDAVDEFAVLWQEIVECQDSWAQYSDIDSNDDQREKGLLDKLFEILEPVYNTVFPSASPQLSSPPSPIALTMIPACLTPLPEPSPAEIIYLEKGIVNEEHEDDVHEPKDKLSKHTSRAEPLFSLSTPLALEPGPAGMDRLVPAPYPEEEVGRFSRRPHGARGGHELPRNGSWSMPHASTSAVPVEVLVERPLLGGEGSSQSQYYLMVCSSDQDEVQAAIDKAEARGETLDVLVMPR